MNSIKIEFKSIVMLLVLAFSMNLLAQNEQNETRTFIRIFNFEGNKVNKGYFQFINDGYLWIRSNKNIVQIDVTEIAHIKTKRSAGNKALLGAVIGGAAGSIIGGVSAEGKETKTETLLFGIEREYSTGTSAGTGALRGAAAGMVGGALVGFGSSIFSNSKLYVIDGKIENLKAFENDIPKIKK